LFLEKSLRELQEVTEIIENSKREEDKEGKMRKLWNCENSQDLHLNKNTKYTPCTDIFCVNCDCVKEGICHKFCNCPPTCALK
jgi:hypothetical protein